MQIQGMALAVRISLGADENQWSKFFRQIDDDIEDKKQIEDKHGSPNNRHIKK